MKNTLVREIKFYVEGRLKNRQWQGEDGNTRYSTEVHVQEFTFLSTKKEHVENAKTSAQTPQHNTPDIAPVAKPLETKQLC